MHLAGTWYHIIRLVQARLDQFYSDNIHAQEASVCVCAPACIMRVPALRACACAQTAGVQ